MSQKKFEHQNHKSLKSANDHLFSKKVWRDFRYFIASGFGSGLAPIAPGTMGTLVGLPIYWLISPLPPLLYAIITILGFGLGVWLCQKISDELNIHDHSSIVWDEIIGMLITLFIIPCTWSNMLLGFLLFRIFDIWKPWPIRWVDKHVKTGLGIMLDDVLAAIPAWIILKIINLILFNN